MPRNLIAQAIELVEKSNADLQPELTAVADARELMAEYARLRKLAEYGFAALAARIDDAAEVARVGGTSMGSAKTAVATGEVLASCGELGAALQHGDISLDQATEIASAEQSAPGSAGDLLKVAQEESFFVLKERARQVKLEAEQHRELGERQHVARAGRHYIDDLGMVHVHLAWEPHVGTPIVNRADAEAARLYRGAKRAGEPEPFERYVADAYAALLSETGKGRAKRPELVVLVSHEVTQRGWKDARPGEVCKIPGIGPIPPEAAKEIAQDAFLTGVFYDGKDLRHIRRWTRNTPVEVRLSLELGSPPGFEGRACVDCGKRLGLQADHVEPHCGGGTASTDNFADRCWDCHHEKTERDRRAGKLKPRPP